MESTLCFPNRTLSPSHTSIDLAAVRGESARQPDSTRPPCPALLCQPLPPVSPRGRQGYPELEPISPCHHIPTNHTNGDAVKQGRGDVSSNKSPTNTSSIAILASPPDTVTDLPSSHTPGTFSFSPCYPPRAASSPGSRSSYGTCVREDRETHRTV